MKDEERERKKRSSMSDDDMILIAEQLFFEFDVAEENDLEQIPGGSASN